MSADSHPCRSCGDPIPYGGRGRRRAFCSKECAIAGIEEHGMTGYTTGCRCEVCRATARDYSREYARTHARRHGITPDEKREIMRARGWACEACGEPFMTPSDAKVDHDHGHCPGREGCRECVRGLLCNGCNAAAGLLADSPERLRALAAYLDRTKFG